MTAEHPLHTQRRNKDWQCQSFVNIVTNDAYALSQHVCELQAGHLGVHLCWCECAFSDDGTTFHQRPLWPTWPSRKRHD